MIHVNSWYAEVSNVCIKIAIRRQWSLRERRNGDLISDGIAVATAMDGEGFLRKRHAGWQLSIRAALNAACHVFIITGEAQHSRDLNRKVGYLRNDKMGAGPSDHVPIAGMHIESEWTRLKLM